MYATVHILGGRLPRWLLPAQWPSQAGRPLLAALHLAQGRVLGLAPHDPDFSAPAGSAWHLNGALLLPGLVDAHTHLDKAFTLPRLGQVEPGLLGAIEAMMVDHQGWTEADITTEERLNQIMQIYRDHGVQINHPHVYIVEDGKQNNLDPAVVGTKQRFDPLGLLNPGKLRSWQARQPQRQTA